MKCMAGGEKLLRILYICSQRDTAAGGQCPVAYPKQGEGLSFSRHTEHLVLYQRQLLK